MHQEKRRKSVVVQWFFVLVVVVVVVRIVNMTIWWEYQSTLLIHFVDWFQVDIIRSARFCLIFRSTSRLNLDRSLLRSIVFLNQSKKEQSNGDYRTKQIPYFSVYVEYSLTGTRWLSSDVMMAIGLFFFLDKWREQSSESTQFHCGWSDDMLSTSWKIR